MDCIASDTFCSNEPGLFMPVFNNVMNKGDFYFYLADFNSYVEAQERAASEYNDPAIWAQKAILNVARTGKFSSDRTISEYAKEIWGIKQYL